MHLSALLIFSIVVSGCIPTSQSDVLAVLNIFKTGFDIFKTGFKIVNVIRKQNSGSYEDIKNQLESVRQDMERMIKSSTTVII